MLSLQKMTLGLMVSILAIPASYASTVALQQKQGLPAAAAPADTSRAHGAVTDTTISNATFPTKVVYDKTDLEIKFGARVKVDFNEDFNGKQAGTTYGLDPASMPLYKMDYDAMRHHNFNTSLTASRISAEIKHQYGSYENYGYLEFDFNGGLSSGTRTSNSYGPRIRHGYVEISDQDKSNDFLIGQTWTHFADPDVNAWSTNNIWPTFRTAQARYTRKVAEGVTLGVSLERPNTQTFQATNPGGTSTNPNIIATSYVDNESGVFNKSSMPDLTMKLKYHQGGNLFSLRGVVRRLEAKIPAGQTTGAPASFNGKQMGWGLGASAMIKIAKPLTFLFQVQGGKGIGKYIDDLSNANAFDSYLQFRTIPTTGVQATAPTSFLALKAINFIGGFTINWNEKWETNIGGAYTKISVPKGIALTNAGVTSGTAQINTKLVRGHVNLVYNIFPKTFIVGEVQRYHRHAGSPVAYKGKDTRLTMSFIRNF